MATLKLKIDKALGDVKDKNQRESGQTAYKPCLKELLVLILGQPPRLAALSAAPRAGITTWPCP